MRPEAEASGYLDAKEKAKAKAKATATATATARATTKANAGILHCVQNDGIGW